MEGQAAERAFAFPKRQRSLSLEREPLMPREERRGMVAMVRMEITEERLLLLIQQAVHQGPAEEAEKEEMEVVVLDAE